MFHFGPRSGSAVGRNTINSLKSNAGREQAHDHHVARLVRDQPSFAKFASMKPGTDELTAPSRACGGKWAIEKGVAEKESLAPYFVICLQAEVTLQRLMNTMACWLIHDE